MKEGEKMNIVTFPLQLDKDFHKTIKKVAFDKEKTLKDYIIEAIKEKMQRDKQ